MLQQHSRLVSQAHGVGEPALLAGQHDVHPQGLQGQRIGPPGRIGLLQGLLRIGHPLCEHFPARGVLGGGHQRADHFRVDACITKRQTEGLQAGGGRRVRERCLEAACLRIIGVETQEPLADRLLPAGIPGDPGQPDRGIEVGRARVDQLIQRIDGLGAVHRIIGWMLLQQYVVPPSLIPFPGHPRTGRRHARGVFQQPGGLGIVADVPGLLGFEQAIGGQHAPAGQAQEHQARRPRRRRFATPGYRHAPADGTAASIAPVARSRRAALRTPSPSPPTSRPAWLSPAYACRH